MTPTDYRRGGANAEIRFAIGASSLGAILVARSERGICAIFLGDASLTDSSGPGASSTPGTYQVKLTQ